MESRVTAEPSQDLKRASRADNRADILRVLAALGLLAFISSFDGAREQPPASEARAVSTSAP